MEDLLMELTLERQPKVARLNIEIIDGFAVVDMYRGTTEEAELKGISWWATDCEVAEFYARSKKGKVLHRKMRLPIQNGYISSPCPHLYGSGGHVNRDINLDRYSYGLDGPIRIDSLGHFEISVSEYALQLMSKEVGTYVAPQPDINRVLQLFF